MNSQRVPLIFEVQTVHNEPNAPKSSKTSFMAVDDDKPLDFSTFKRYMLQQVGITGNVPVKYVDDDNDQIPIESEDEFNEAIKVARERSSKGMVLMLIVDISKNISQELDCSSNSLEQKEKIKIPLSLVCKTPLRKKQGVKPSVKSSVHCSSCNSDRCHSLCKYPFNLSGQRILNDKSRLGVKAPTPPVHVRAKLLQQVLTNMAMSSNPGISAPTAAGVGAAEQNLAIPPAWFISYMEKFKSDILLAVREMIAAKKGELPLPKEVKTKQQRVKRQSEDESSDNQQCGSEPRSCKILRKLEKLQKREKKLEHKLDQRLEKMESKKKRMLEKVSQTKTVKRKSGEGLGSVPYLMSGISTKPLSPVHVRPGEVFPRTWEILNDGTIPWTDATEIRQAWGSAGLDPETTVVKCPLLAPGEQGSITVIFSAPVQPGTYHSYWHLFHMGERFGHWIVCTVVVETSLFTNGEVAEAEFTQSLINANQEGEKDLVEKLNAVTLAENPEYDSGSDLEVCSNISESDSVDSFVVVDLPMFLFSDSPAESKGTIPVKVRSKNCEVYFKTEKKKNAKSSQVKNDSKVGGETSRLITENTCIRQSTSNENITAPYEPVQGSVYMVDRAGNCIIAPTTQSAGLYSTVDPAYNVAYPVYTQQMSTIHDISPNYYCYPPVMSYPYTGQNVEYPVGVTTSTATQQATTVAGAYSPTNSGNVTYPCQSVEYPVGVTTCTAAQQGSSVAPQTKNFGNVSYPYPVGPTTSATTHQTATSIGVSCSPTFLHTKNSGNINRPITDTGIVHKTPLLSGDNQTHENMTAKMPSDDSERAIKPTEHVVHESPVHILPETLVNGALNVASKAYNTAQSVLNNLRTKQSEASEYDPVFETNLVTLFEMGFTNTSRNVEVLKSVGNNIGLAVPILLI